MKTLVRAIITGFGLSVGAAIYKHLSKRLGLDEKEGRSEVPVPAKTDGEVETGNAERDPDAILVQ